MKKSYTIFILLCMPVLIRAQWISLTIPTTKDIRSSSFISDNEGWIGTQNSASDAIILHTADGGATWNSDTITGASNGTSYLEFINSNLGFAVVNGQAFRTTDAGANWSQLTLPGIPYNEPYFLNADTGFISGNGYYNFVYKTVDGGNTWYSVYVEPGEGSPFNRINFLNDSIGIATANDETAYTTADGGDHWILLYFSTFYYYKSACYSKTGKSFVAGYEDYAGLGIYYPFIYAEHGWSDNYYYEGCIPQDIASFENSRVYAVGECGHIIYTENDGYQWIDTTLAATELTIVDGIHNIYIFGKNGKGFKRPSYCVTAALFTFTASDLDVTFTDQSSNATSWSWVFGDSSTSTDQNPAHTFSVAGSYNVCLTASGPCGVNTLCYPVVVCASNFSLSPEGALDPTFADNGILVDDSTGDYEEVYTLRIQADGKILACDRGDFANIIRYNTDGTRDSSFGSDGVISEPYISNSYTAQNRMALAPDGKITLCRRAANQVDIQISRYNTNGSIDSSFDEDGLVLKDLSQINEGYWFISSVFQPDGKLLVYTIASTMNVARFNVDGSLDLSFASDGIFNSDAVIYNTLGDISVQDDGKIIIGGSIEQSGSSYYLMRVNANGTIDSSFGINGIVKSNFLSNIYTINYLHAILIQPDGKYLATGTGMYESLIDYKWHRFYALERFSSTGIRDSSFGSSGRDTFQIASSDSYGTDAEMQPDGKILITGYYGDPYAGYNIGLLRLNEDATFDSTFGNYGMVSTSIACKNTVSYSIALDSNNIYVGGQDPTLHFLIAKYNNSPVAPCNADFILLPDTSNTGFYWGYNLSSGNNLLYSWTWGDGTSSTGQYPTHLYTDSGFYNICLMVSDSLSTCADTFCADYSILKTEEMMQIHEINFVDYPLPVPQTGNAMEWNIYPNPFSTSATIQFTLNEQSSVSIKLFSLEGNEVQNITEQNFPVGDHDVILNRANLVGGVYVLKMVTAKSTGTRSVIIQ